MRILLLAQIDSIFTYELVSNIKTHNPKVKFDIFSPRAPKNIERYKHLFENIYYPNQIFHKTPIAKTIVSVASLFKFIFSKKVQYDSLHTLFIDYNSYFNVYFFKKISKKIILTIYGSDYYALNNIQHFFFNKSINKADKVTSTNPKITSKLKEKFSDLPIETIRFGLTPLQYMIKLDKEKSLKHFPNFENKFIITCGYHARRNNNHLKIIEAINTIKFDLPKNYLLVFQLSYGREADYIKEIKKLIEKYKLNTYYIEEYLPHEYIGALRLLSDISIQPLETDSFSGTVQEYLFSENILISGDWLPYNLLVEKGVYFETINNFNELPKKISYCLKNYTTLKEKTKKNKDIIWSLSSWEVNLKKWIQLYN